ncbi:MAG: molybdopterin-dependent oxidoreductase Mo/Fe-S-binding subunit [Spirochaetaceae bacterium]|nr:molybdopterin-dependent oxidoreductase Mo/Fe-S-binding subunit [Spirochaetaceae bacterium]
MKKIECIINGKNSILPFEEGMSLREALFNTGLNSVRDSDNSEGFVGSDTILVDDIPCYSNLMSPYQVKNKTIRTAESLGDQRNINFVQKAMIDSGIVQSAYNSPAAALLLTWLLEHFEQPTRAQIKDLLTSIFIRDAGYENYYLAVKLATELRDFGKYKTKIAKEYRDQLHFIGKTIGKIDGASLVAGDKCFVEDKVSEHSHVMIVLGSPHAHAYIVKIDTSKAEALAGVDKILTYKNTPEIFYTHAGQGSPEPSPYDKKLFNQKVRMEGDRVAAIIAVDMEIAEKARDLIEVEYEVLKPILTVEDAMAPGAALVHNGKIEFGVGAPDNLDELNANYDERDGKVFYPFPLHSDIRHNVASEAKGQIGDVDKAFKEADCVIERTYRTNQIQCTPLEPHVCFGKIELGRLVLHCSTQVPFHVRRIVAKVCDISENNIHVIKEKVGGGYGSKQDVVVEDLVGYAVWNTGLDIYFRNTRREEFLRTATRHPMRLTVKLGAKKDGSITAIDMDVKANTGCYGNHCLTVPMNSCSKTLPLMKVDNMRFDVTTYYTNIASVGAYQGYGAPKGTFALMTAIAELSAELGLDYKDVIEKNHVEEGYMLEILRGLGEGREGNVVPVGSCGLDQAIEKGAKMINWGIKEKSPAKDWKVGKGFAMIQQGSGLPGLDHSNAWAKIMTDGSVKLFSGGADLGTGLDTVCAKVVCENLKVAFDKISITSGDTDSCNFDTGAYASSGTYFTGNASRLAAEDLVKSVIKEAAFQMGEKESDLYLDFPGKVVSKQTKKELSYATLSHDALTGTGNGQIIGKGSFTTAANSIPYGAHFAQVAVNEKTGQVKVQKFYALQDAGTPINPAQAECQMYGAALKSIGHTLYEGLIYDKKGVAQNTTFSSYGVPMINEMPEDFKAVLIDIDDNDGPYGAKSISEIATNGAAPAIAIAIHDAVGIWMRSWPFTPEKILKEMGTLK